MKSPTESASAAAAADFFPYRTNGRFFSESSTDASPAVSRWPGRVLAYICSRGSPQGVRLQATGSPPPRPPPTAG